MVKGKIAPDDLRPGQFVIVTEWYDEAEKEEESYDFWGHRQEKPKKQVGVPFKVLAVAIPFVTLEAIGSDASKAAPRGILDTRLAALMEVDLRYVRSLAPGYTPSGPRRRSDMTKDERLIVQRWTAKKGWEEVRKEPS